jgi:hypothetical protein
MTKQEIGLMLGTVLLQEKYKSKDRFTSRGFAKRLLNCPNEFTFPRSYSRCRLLVSVNLAWLGSAALMLNELREHFK